MWYFRKLWACLCMPDCTHSKMAINLKLSWTFTYMQKINTIPGPNEILKIFYFNMLWVCLGKPDHTHPKYENQFEALVKFKLDTKSKRIALFIVEIFKILYFGPLWACLRNELPCPAAHCFILNNKVETPWSVYSHN